MKFRWIIFPLAAAILQSCAGGDKSKQTDTLTEVPVIKLSRKDTTISADYVADIQAIRNVDIRARIHGYIDRIYVDEGQRVNKGQLLFKLSDKEYHIQLSRAKADLISAESATRIADVELGRIKTLVNKKVISPSEQSLGEARLSEAQAKLASARAMIEEANQKLSYTEIRSPFDGIVDKLPLKAGSLVAEGDLVTSVSDTRQMYGYFDVSENEYLQFMRTGKDRFGENKTVSLILSDGSKYPVAGRIQTHEGSFSGNTGSIAFRAVFPNPDRILKHGASGKIQISSELAGSLLIPQKSVFEIQDKSYVYVLGKDNIVRMKSFVPKMRLAAYYVCAEGLQPGETIVYEGLQQLRDGATVRPVDVSARTLLAKK